MGIPPEIGTELNGASAKDGVKHRRRTLMELRWARGCEFRLHRARLRMKARVLWRLVPLLALAVSGLATVLALEGSLSWLTIVLVCVAGALGGVLAGFLKLRDSVTRIGDLRALRPAAYVQPLLGASAGLVMLLVAVAGFLPAGDATAGLTSKYAVLAFAAGFSEPFFLQTVSRVAQLEGTRRGPSSPA
jgi:hypothetical protein